MECDRVKDLLSEYIDGALGAQDRAAVEKHIAACEECKKELASMSALVEKLGALEPVKAPADFLEEIHGRLKPRFSFDRIIRKLFTPFRIKIPLKLVAAATMAILVFYVFSLQQADKTLLKAPVISTPKDIATKHSAHLGGPALKKASKRDVHISEETEPKSLNNEDFMATRKSMTKTVKPTLRMKPEQLPTDLEKQSSVGFDRAGKPIELAVLLKPRDYNRAHTPYLEAESASQPETDTRVVQKESPGTASFKEKAPAKKRYPAPRHSEDTLSNVEHITGLAEGRVLSLKHNRQSKRLEFIDVEIPAKHYRSFCQDLATIAELRSTPPALSDKERKTIQVRIKLIFPE